MPDLIIRGTADDIFLYTTEESEALVNNPNKYIRQECILNFESINIGNKVGLKDQYSTTERLWTYKKNLMTIETKQGA